MPSTFPLIFRIITPQPFVAEDGLALLTARVAPSSQTLIDRPKSYFPLHDAADLLAAAIARAANLSTPQSERRSHLAAAAYAVDELLPHFTSAAVLTAALASTNPASDASLLKTFAQVEADLRFSPRIEADVPNAWPAFTPVNEVEVKTYPACRAAFIFRQPLFFAQARLASALATHLATFGIPMTTPVKLPLTLTATGNFRPSGMAYVYPNPSLGTPGPTADPDITVIDVPPATYLSLAHQGKPTDSRLARAHARLRACLTAYPHLKPSAARRPRLLAWNSPGTPDVQSYNEVQIPLDPAN